MSLVDTKGNTVLDIFRSHGGGQFPDEDDANLIEAAPALLAACKAVAPILDSADSWSDDDHTIMMDKHDWRRLIRQVYAAIAAVEGEP